MSAVPVKPIFSFQLGSFDREIIIRLEIDTRLTKFENWRVYIGQSFFLRRFTFTSERVSCVCVCVAVKRSITLPGAKIRAAPNMQAFRCVSSINSFNKIHINIHRAVGNNNRIHQNRPAVAVQNRRMTVMAFETTAVVTGSVGLLLSFSVSPLI